MLGIDPARGPPGRDEAGARGPPQGRRLDARRARKPAAQTMLRRLIERRSFRQPFRSTLTADFTANIVRNVWAYAIIFCGHFPDQTYTFSQEETEDESRGARHVRQLLGSANIEGSPLFHVISGNLGYQVEHHIFPDMPSTGTARSRRGFARSASATTCPTTPARSSSSWPQFSGRSPSRSRAASRAQAGALPRSPLPR